MPSSLLSNVASAFSLTQNPLGNIQLNISTYSVKSNNICLHFYGLTIDVTTKEIEKYLEPFKGHFYIKWIDDNNLLVFFNFMVPTTPDALLEVLSECPFKIKVIKDSTEFEKSRANDSNKEKKLIFGEMMKKN